MRLAGLSGVLLLAACATQPSTPLTPPPAAPLTAQKSPAECGVQLGKYLEMGFEQFDQRPEGWREIGGKPGCETAAAEVIRQYREWLLSRMDGMIGHEAQLRASAGDTEAGLRLFRQEQAMQTEAEAGDTVNKLTADAQIAFLEGDRDALVAARAKLAALPKPEGFDEAVQKARERTGRPDLQIPWPQNLGMVDGLIRCVGRPYKLAFFYDCDEAQAAKKESGG